MSLFTETTDAAGDASTAYMIGIGDTFDGAVSPTDPTDLVGVALGAGNSYTITLRGVASSDRFNLVYEGPGGQSGSVSFGDETSTGAVDSFTANQETGITVLTFTATTSGTYYFGIDLLSTSFAEVDYTMSLETTALLAPTEGDDNLVGSESADTIHLLGGNDIFVADDGSDFIYGDAGDDQLDGNCGNDTLDGGEGNDSIDGGNGADTIFGGNGADYLFGANQEDTIYGGDGDDTVDGGNGDDTLQGDGGNDTVYGHNGADLIYGNDGTDTLYGGSENDTMFGGAGADTLDGGWGDDVMTGNADTDIFVFANNTGHDTITDFEHGIDKLDVTGLGLYDLNAMTFTQLGADLHIGFGAGESVTLLGTDAAGIDSGDFLLAAAPVSTGTATADVLYLTNGADTADSGDGADKIYGYGGNDTLTAGTGDDTVFAGTGDDTVDAGSGKDKVRGHNGDDTIFGMSGNDLLFGDAGNDTLDGGANNDRVYGGADNDTLLGGSGNDKLYGEDGADTLLGGAGKDRLFGGDGADTLTGGFGDDQLTGGAGADIFAFEDRARADTINDFENGTDLLDVSAFGFAGLADMTLTETGTDVLIDFNGRDMVTLTGVALADIDASDFLF